MVGFMKIDLMAALVMIIIVKFMANFQATNGAIVYKVGDSTGWTTIGNYNYTQWAATKTFHVGDIILFEYHTQFHNVMQVKHKEYSSCNVSTPIATYTTGNDSITITNHGHHFFLCGVPGHCQSGQKVDIHVPRISATAPTPSSPANGVPSPSNSSTLAQGPTSHGGSLCFSNGVWTTLGLIMASVYSFCF